ncbi:MAG: hypothetical protein JSV54_02515 [Chloroflexota bacterium]|nr:MAG: hypothetical protein JSV54_02515 [Chloroflexota bacterium]
MAKLLRTQLFPACSGIKEPATKTWAEKLTVFLDETFRRVASIPFNQSENLDVADTGNADTEFTVAHYLGRVPAGFILINTDKAACVYDSGTAWTTSAIYLKCNAANAAITITVF